MQVSGFCLCSVVTHTIHSHLTLMQLSCIYSHQLFMFNKEGGGVVIRFVYPFVLLIFCLIFCLLNRDTSYFLKCVFLASELQVFTDNLGQTDLQRNAMTDREDTILQICLKLNLPLHHMITSHDWLAGSVGHHNLMKQAGNHMCAQVICDQVECMWNNQNK